MTLSNMIRTIIEDFIPALHYKYVFQNFKQSASYRSYNPAVVPAYLQGRPKSTVLHCLHRKASSNKITDTMIKATCIHKGKFEVLGKNKVHTVDFGISSSVPSCTCKDWKAYRIPCKHFFAVFNWFPEWGWEKLPISYQNSPYLCLDDDAITTYLQQHNDEESPPLTPGKHELADTQPIPPESTDQSTGSQRLCESVNDQLEDLPGKVSS